MEAALTFNSHEPFANVENVRSTIRLFALKPRVFLAFAPPPCSSLRLLLAGPRFELGGMFRFTFTTFLSIVLALDQALALVLRTPVEPYSPQLSMGPTPPKCRDVCSAISKAVDSCTTDSCLCTASNAIALRGCMKCVYSVSPTDAVRESVQGEFNQLMGTCKDFSLEELWISASEPADPSTTNPASSEDGAGSSSNSETTPSPPVVTITASFPTTETVYSTTSTHTPSTTVTVVVTHVVPPGANPSSSGSSANSTQSSSSSSNSGFYSHTSSLIGATSLLSALLLSF